MARSSSYVSRARRTSCAEEHRLRTRGVACSQPRIGDRHEVVGHGSCERPPASPGRHEVAQGRQRKDMLIVANIEVRKGNENKPAALATVEPRCEARAKKIAVQTVAKKS